MKCVLFGLCTYEQVHTCNAPTKWVKVVGSNNKSLVNPLAPVGWVPRAELTCLTQDLHPLSDDAVSTTTGWYGGFKDQLGQIFLPMHQLLSRSLTTCLMGGEAS